LDSNWAWHQLYSWNAVRINLKSLSIVFYSLLNPARSLSPNFPRFIVRKLVELKVDVGTRHVATLLEPRTREKL
jgi:hypothetical protein